MRAVASKHRKGSGERKKESGGGGVGGVGWLRVAAVEMGEARKKRSRFFFELGCQCELLLKRSCPTHSCNEEASGESIFSPFLLLLY
jgi:hypothetical protein